MNIHHDDPKWTAYVLGELSETERAEVERELESSVEAREIVDEIRMMTSLLKDELAKEPQVALRPEQQAAVTATAAGPNRRRWGWPQWAVAGFGTAVAAALLLAVGLSPVLRSREPEMAARIGSSPAITVQPQAALPPAAEPSRERPAAAARQSAEAPKAAQNAMEERLQAMAPMEKEADMPAPAPAELKDMTVAGQAAQGQLGDGNLRNAKQGPPPQLGQQGQGARDLRFENYAQPAAAPPPPFGPKVISPPGGIRPDEPVRRYNTEAYDRVEDNPFKSAAENPLATFSIDVDTASYANMRRFLNQNQLPPKDSVRIEELINYFNYDYAPPSGQQPIAVHTEVAAAPWKSDHRLVRIGIKAKDIDLNSRPRSNLVFLIDVSGSMDSPEKLPLLKSSLKLLVDKLTENDRVAIAVYAGNSGLVLPSTTGDKKAAIVEALDRLQAGGSTNGASGIRLAYDTAVAGFIKGGVNRVVLCTDGDFNVGVTNQGDLTRLIEDKAKSGVFLSVLGFGMGNLKDSTMEKLADRGNGHYAYIDSLNEGRKVLVEEMSGTLMTIAKDVKIQVDFNPAQVNAYRLIGYENRILQTQDFNDDTKDAGDMGAGHTVTALFEIVPRGVNVALPTVDASKYQKAEAAAAAADKKAGGSNELLTVRVRYKRPDADTSVRFDVPLVDRRASFDAASDDYRFAASVAEFGMILRDSPHKGSGSLDHVINVAERSKGTDRNGYREEFVKLARKARALKDLQ